MKKISKVLHWVTSSVVLVLILSGTAFGDEQFSGTVDILNSDSNVTITLDSNGIFIIRGIKRGNALTQALFFSSITLDAGVPQAYLQIGSNEADGLKGQVTIKGRDNNGKTAPLSITSGNQTMLIDGNEIDAQKNGLHLNYNSDGKVSIARGGGNVAIGKANAETKLDVAGTTRTKVLEITGGSDLAEPFKFVNAKSVKPGMVVSIDPERLGQLRIANQAYDRTVAGIVSGANGLNPGLTMKQEDTIAHETFPVALTGRVYCWVDATKNPIQPGDLLTTSDIPGYAMKVADYTEAQGAIIGKAMTGLQQGKGLVLTLVSLQ